MGALYAMQGRVCAYCEQKLPESDRGDVEHFRPKSLYRWLAYAFENYLLSCGHVQPNTELWKPGTQMHCHQTGRGYGHLGTIVRRVRAPRIAGAAS